MDCMFIWLCACISLYINCLFESQNGLIIKREVSKQTIAVSVLAVSVEAGDWQCVCVCVCVRCVCSLSLHNICIPLAHINPPFSLRKKEMGDITPKDNAPHTSSTHETALSDLSVTYITLPRSNQIQHLKIKIRAHNVTRNTRFYDRCLAWYISVGRQRVADEGHVGARGGVDDGIHVWRLKRTFSSSGFGKLLLVGVRLPDLLPICKRRQSRNVFFFTVWPLKWQCKLENKKVIPQRHYSFLWITHMRTWKCKNKWQMHFHFYSNNTCGQF